MWVTLVLFSSGMGRPGVVTAVMHLCNSGYGMPCQAIALSEDHKPENPIERNRIRAAGGQARHGKRGTAKCLSSCLSLGPSSLAKYHSIAGH